MIDLSPSKLLIWVSISFTVISTMVGFFILVSTYLFKWLSAYYIVFSVYAVVVTIILTVFMYFVCPVVYEVD